LDKLNNECEVEVKDLDKFIKKNIKLLKETKDNFDYIYKSLKKIKKMQEGGLD
jgi:hypothetical protein